MRHARIPDWVKKLLADGEHPHVDYKQVIPREFPKSVAAAANTVALRENFDEFVFLVGVEEVVKQGGVRSGKVVGLVDPATGDLRDFEAEQQKAVNLAKTVNPPPDIEIDECNASTSKPFFAIRVRPTDAPHRVDDRYLMRKGSHTVPLDQANLRRLFVAARVEAFIEEISEDNPLSRALVDLLKEVATLQGQVANVSFDLADESAERRRSEEQLAQRQDQLARMIEHDEIRDDIHRGVDELVGLTGSIAGDLDSVGEAVNDLRSARTFQSAWLEVQMARSEAWIEFNRRLERGDLPELAARTGRQLFEAFFFDEVDPADYVGNRSELTGWNVLYQAGSSTDINSWAYLLDRACRAAVARAHRGRFAGPWMEIEGEDERFDMRDLAVAAKVGFDTLSILPTGTSESCLVAVEASAWHAEVDRTAARLFALPGGLEVLRLADCRVEARVSDNGIVALCVQPQPRIADRPDSMTFFRQIRRRLRRREFEVVRLSPRIGGRLGALAGQRTRSSTNTSPSSTRSGRRSNRVTRTSS